MLIIMFLDLLPGFFDKREGALQPGGSLVNRG